jgi:hypothetical protein
MGALDLHVGKNVCASINDWNTYKHKQIALQEMVSDKHG